MKELNKLLDKLDKECPHVLYKLEKYGEGKIIQVIVGDINTKSLQIKENKETGVYKTETDNLDVIEVLYKNNTEKKKFIKELIGILKEKLEGRIVYVSCLSQTKDTLLLQVYALDVVNSFRF